MAGHYRTLHLTPTQRDQLIELRDHDARPHVRERCAAVLKVAEGATPHWVARQGLLKARDPDTVYGWLTLYEAEGQAGLSAHQQGGYHGRSLAEHRAEVEEQLHQPPPTRLETTPPPATPVIAPCRYRLETIRALFPWLAEYTLSGVWRVLERLGIGWKQGYVNQWSPDPLYLARRKYIEKCLKHVMADPKHVVALFAEEMSYHRWPTAAPDWWPRAEGAPRAEHGNHNNQQWRIIAGVNAYTGQVTYRQNYIVGRQEVIRFHEQVHQDYRRADKIYVIEDNWNVHALPEVQAAAHALGNLEIVWLPTYACWLNPAEKLWRWLRQTVLHRHRLAEDWVSLKQLVAAFLDQFRQGSTDLLRYVGLLGEGRFAKILHP